MVDGPVFADAKLASSIELDRASKEFGVALPLDYRAFMIDHGAGEGFVGDHYLVLWADSELVRFNREYQFSDYAPGIIAFGGNGGGEAFGFDTRTNPYKIVVVPLIGMALDTALPVADNFITFLERLKTDVSLFD